ncbi:hypothetical protein JTE90_006843 [Oedothorax gibbosus]|uniref:SMB domain-containing protein n=1 Tax=Oedothorax gibbosus TaxID=931172 RepID=A0AAV6TUN3_9ARAC|nr:hypothetical protein JTE90_006843 [Oedothorax gibbosus]
MFCGTEFSPTKMTVFLILGVLSGSIPVEASDTFNQLGDCAAVDSCRTGDQLFRTCSCDPNCSIYGTCCRDSEFARKMAPPSKAKFKCNNDRVVTPVYAKRACLDSFTAHPGNRIFCEEEEHDDRADVMGTVLVTSVKTKITYWNINCGICNDEDPDDLIRWTVEVSCPKKHGSTRFNESYAEQHLIYDKDIEEWGLKVEDGFKICNLSFEQPRYSAGNLSYCAPNLVTSCPTGYEKKGVVEKCHAYHAERRLKGEVSVYYRNAHCAQCNDVEEEDLECSGRIYDTVGVAKERDNVILKFEEEWLDRNGSVKYTCSWNNTWDPFNLRCRKLPMDLWQKVAAKSAITNSAVKATFNSSLFAFIVTAVSFKIRTRA